MRDRMKTSIKLVVLFFIILAIVAVVHVTQISSLLTLEQIKEKSIALKNTVHEHYVQSVFTYIALVVAIAASSLPLVIIIVLAGGFLFGTFLGALYATIGATLGGVIAFVVFRYLLSAFVQEHYTQQLRTFNDKIHRYGYTYIIILHYLTVIPLFIINMFAALTPISLSHFIVLTLLGSAPLYLVYAFAGRELATIRCAQDIFSVPVILACMLLIVMALIPMLIKRYQRVE